MASYTRYLSVCLLLQFVFFSFGYESNISFISNERHVYKYLMADYEKSIRPARDNETITVRVALSFTSIDELDEPTQTLYTTGWLQFTWDDVQLMWNPGDYGGCDHVHIPSSEIWTPDISVYNSKDAYGTPSLLHNAIVSSDGNVHWIPPVNLMTHCNIDLTDFPFDVQTCEIKFGSWTYDMGKINLSSYHMEDYDHSNWFGVNSQWDLLKLDSAVHRVIYPCCAEEYGDVTYTLKLKRRTTLAAHLFVGPSVVLCLIIPLVFLLPPASTAKMILGIGLLLAHVELLDELMQYLPNSHPTMPYIGQYFVANIVLVTLSLAASALIMNIWDKSTTRLMPPPTICRVLFLGPVSRLLCVNKDQFAASEEEVMSNQNNIQVVGENAENGGVKLDDRSEMMRNYLRNAARSEWRQLAVVFDRILFILFFLVIACLTLAFVKYI